MVGPKNCMVLVWWKAEVGLFNQVYMSLCNFHFNCSPEILTDVSTCLNQVH